MALFILSAICLLNDNLLSRFQSKLFLDWGKFKLKTISGFFVRVKGNFPLVCQTLYDRQVIMDYWSKSNHTINKGE